MRTVPIVIAAALIGSSVSAQTVHPDADVVPVEIVRDARHSLPSKGAPLGLLNGGDPCPGFVFTGDDPEGDAPADVVFTPDGSTIVVAHCESANLILWDADTRDFIAAIPLTALPQAVAITPDGATAVVGLLTESAVSIVDLDTATETDVIPLAGYVGGVRITDAGDLAALGLPFAGAIAVLNLDTLTVERTIGDVGFAQTFSFSPESSGVSLQFSRFEFVDGDRVLNVDRFGDRAQFVDVRTGTVTNVPITGNGGNPAVSGDRTRAAVAHTGSERTVTVLDPATPSVVDTVSTSVDLFRGEIALNTDGTRAAATVLNATIVLDLLAGTHGPSLNTASINEMVTTADGQYALCIGFRGSLISFASGTIVTELNNVVSTEFGAVSPVGTRAAMFSTTFGDDMVVVDTNGAAGGLEAFMLSGPVEEGDRCRTVAITPDGSTAAAVSIFSDTLAVVDTDSEAVTGWAPLGQRPSAVAITADGTKAVVGNLDSTYATIVDLASATSTDVPISRRAGGVVISPDHAYAYLNVVADGDGVWRINLNTGLAEGPKLITGNGGGVGYSFGQTSGIAISPDGTQVAVAGSFTDEVTFVDAAAWSVEATTPVMGFPTILAYAPDGSNLYVARKNSDRVDEIDTTTHAVTRSFIVGDQPWHLVPTPDALYVHNWAAGNVQRVDLVTGLVSHTHVLANTGTSMMFDTTGERVLVGTVSGSTTLGGEIGFLRIEGGEIEALNADDLTLLETIPVGKVSSAGAIDAAGDTIVLAALTGDGMVVVDLGSDCPGDADGNGVVDIDDLLVVVGTFDTDDPAGDVNGDGFVDIDDLLLVVGAWGPCP